ncbi:MAG: hypothetical protein ACO3SO_01245 [Luteolibacter sp.]|jgi:GDP-D-mannose dehydratase
MAHWRPGEGEISAAWPTTTWSPPVELHAVRERIELVFGKLDLNYEDHVDVDPRFVRPDEQLPLLGGASKARDWAGIRPTVREHG